MHATPTTAARAPLDLSLYLILDPDQCGGHARALDVARRAVAGGATLVQLRAPAWHKRAWLALAVDLLRLLRPLRVALIINDQLDVALACGADGVHLGQRDLPPECARRLLGPQAWIGLSVSDAAQLAAAEALPAGQVDYLGIGPVWATATKPDAAPPCGLDGLARLVRGTRYPTVAIGGIDAGNAGAVAATGTGGLAVVSTLCRAADPAQAARDLRTALASARP